MSITNKIIVVDPGHGGIYDGATYGSVKEKDITLAVANKVRTKLETLDAYVRQTRYGDTDFGGSTAAEDINKRVNYINSNYGYNYAALVSLHINSASGFKSPYYYNGTTGTTEQERINSRNLANDIAVEMGHILYRTGDFAILRDTWGSIPKVLVEMEQIDSGLITQSWWQDEVSTQIVNGLKSYFGS